MSNTLPAFTPMENTLFLRLCGRALDNRPDVPADRSRPGSDTH